MKKAYKLCRLLKSGEITPLFINKKMRIPFNEWLPAENHPTPNYKVRPYWHCLSIPYAPHLSKKDRAWTEVHIEDYQELERPFHQGGFWYLANKIKFVRIYEPEEILNIQLGYSHIKHAIDLSKQYGYPIDL